MASKAQAPKVHKPATSRGLVRDVTYLHEDDESGLVAYASGSPRPKQSAGRCGRFCESKTDFMRLA